MRREFNSNYSSKMDDTKEIENAVDLKLKEALSLSESAADALSNIARGNIARDMVDNKEFEQLIQSNKQITDLIGKIKNTNTKVASQNSIAMSVSDADVERLVDYLEGRVSDKQEATIQKSTQPKSL